MITKNIKRKSSSATHLWLAVAVLVISNVVFCACVRANIEITSPGAGALICASSTEVDANIDWNSMVENTDLYDEVTENEGPGAEMDNYYENDTGTYWKDTACALDQGVNDICVYDYANSSDSDTVRVKSSGATTGALVTSVTFTSANCTGAPWNAYFTYTIDCIPSAWTTLYVEEWVQYTQVCAGSTGGWTKKSSMTGPWASPLSASDAVGWASMVGFDFPCEEDANVKIYVGPSLGSQAATIYGNHVKHATFTGKDNCTASFGGISDSGGCN